MGKLVPLKVDGELYELRPAQKDNIFQILKSATVVPDGMKPRTMTGTEYEPIVHTVKAEKPKMTPMTARREKEKKKKGIWNKNK